MNQNGILYNAGVPSRGLTKLDGVDVVWTTDTSHETAFVFRVVKAGESN
jgi:hypothetical protein